MAVEPGRRRCRRKRLRHDDGKFWFVCKLCKAVWSERIMGGGFRPSVCIMGSHIRDQLPYHAMPRDKS